jgi:hypothetical protein
LSFCYDDPGTITREHPTAKLNLPDKLSFLLQEIYAHQVFYKKVCLESICQSLEPANGLANKRRDDYFDYKQPNAIASA